MSKRWLNFFLQEMKENMISNYEAWLKVELAFRRQAMLNRIDDLEHVLKGVRTRVNEDGYLNDLGELQQIGVMLDTAIAAYATERQALKNYIEMEKAA